MSSSTSLGACHLCGAKPATVRDHCHDDGRIRGLLCNGCNVLAQNPDRLRRALAYVEASPIGPEYAEWRRVATAEYQSTEAARAARRARDNRRYAERMATDPEYRERRRTHGREAQRRLRSRGAAS